MADPQIRPVNNGPGASVRDMQPASGYGQRPAGNTSQAFGFFVYPVYHSGGLFRTDDVDKRQSSHSVSGGGYPGFEHMPDRGRWPVTGCSIVQPGGPQTDIIDGKVLTMGALTTLTNEAFGFLKARKYVEAEEAFKALLNTPALSFLLTDQQKSNVSVGLARAYIKQGKHQCALELLKSITNNHSRDYKMTCANAAQGLMSWLSENDAFLKEMVAMQTDL